MMKTTSKHVTLMEVIVAYQLQKMQQDVVAVYAQIIRARTIVGRCLMYPIFILHLTIVSATMNLIMLVATMMSEIVALQTTLLKRVLHALINFATA